MQRIALALGAVLAMGACTDVGGQGLPSEHLWNKAFVARQLQTSHIVLVVDDGPSAESAELRAAVSDGLRRSVIRLYEEALPLDPAAWTPFDIGVVLVFPSRPPGLRVVGPPTHAALAIRRSDPEAADIEALSDAVDALLDGAPASASAPYRPLEAVADTLALLHGERAPDGASERALVDALARPTHRAIEVALATARDDESPLPPWSYDISLGPLPHGHTQLYAIVPPDYAVPCGEATGGASTRVSSWAAAIVDGSGAWSVAQPWPCPMHQLPQAGLISVPFTDASPRGWCTSKAIAMDPPGRASCRVIVDAGTCDPQRGWRRSDADGLCEVAQLEGDALQACRSTTECEGCGSGWCVAEPSPWLDVLEGCSAGRHPSRIRFTGMSVTGATARFEIACRLVE